MKWIGELCFMGLRIKKETSGCNGMENRLVMEKLLHSYYIQLFEVSVLFCDMSRHGVGTFMVFRDPEIVTV